MDEEKQEIKETRYDSFEGWVVGMFSKDDDEDDE